MKTRQPIICFFGTYDKDYTSNKIVLQGLRENNLRVIEVNAHTPVTNLTTKADMSWLQLLKRISRKYRIFKEIFKNFNQLKKADAIYVGYPGHFDVLLAFVIAKFLGKKLIFNPIIIFYTGFTEEQGILSKTSLLGRLAKIGEGFIYRLVDLILADTPFQKKFLQKIFHLPLNKIKVLPLGADNRAYQYTPYTNLSQSINVVYYGLYSPIHGVEHIIEAANLLKKNKDIKFILIGQGNTFEANFNRAKQLKLSNIKFVHHVPQEQHFPILKQADIFLGFLQDHPSVERIIPNKVYQGLSLGKVVLTADSPIIRSVFTHKKNMYFCQPANPQSLALAITKLKNNPKLRQQIAEAGYQLYQNQFTPRAVANKLIKYVRRII